ncbi:hypothetical protein [uncultured Bifidobacterium sp.]|uniref:hypothetical protein n=1 Tax=uncultured Bifidobacterium sp. TaxID=165187 RepID=UPI00338FE10C
MIQRNIEDAISEKILMGELHDDHGCVCPVAIPVPQATEICRRCRKSVRDCRHC